MNARENICIKSAKSLFNACIMVATSRAVDKWPRSVSPCGFWNVDLVIPNFLAVLFMLFANGASEPEIASASAVAVSLVPICCSANKVSQLESLALWL